MGDGGTAQAKAAEFDPILLAVLSNRFESIIREMTNTVMKASRSSVIKNARDMSCGILTYDHRLVSVEEALPIHVTALELTTKPITELFDDIKEGDAFLNNSPVLRRHASCRPDLVRAGVLRRRAAVLDPGALASRRYRRAGADHLSALCRDHL